MQSYPIVDIIKFLYYNLIMEKIFDVQIIKPTSNTVEKPAIPCRFYAENGECVFNALRGTDQVPSLASTDNSLHINSPRYRAYMCGAVAESLINNQSNCDQYEKAAPDSALRVIYPPFKIDL